MRFDGMIPGTEQIRAAVLRELGRDPRLSDADIEVSVRDGTATLSGAVTSDAQLRAALEAARRADFVFDAINRLVVVHSGDGGRPTDQELASDVKSMLALDASLPHRSIGVAVSNGWVALRGKVARPCEREGAERAARRLRGVRGVYNLLEVSPRGDQPSRRPVTRSMQMR